MSKPDGPGGYGPRARSSAQTSPPMRRSGLLLTGGGGITAIARILRGAPCLFVQRSGRADNAPRNAPIAGAMSILTRIAVSAAALTVLFAVPAGAAVTASQVTSPAGATSYDLDLDHPGT